MNWLAEQRSSVSFARSIITLPAMSTPEVLQSTILHTLDRQGSIADTRSLELTPSASSGPATVVGPTLEAQNAVKGVLDSLVAKEVRRRPLLPVRA